MNVWALVIGAYLLGSVLPGEILVRRAVGKDPEALGENPGIAGTFRAAGVRAGVLAMIFDLSKGALPVAVAIHWGVHAPWLGFVAAAPVAGHNWSVFERFDGGLGLGPATGAVMWVAWPQMLPAYLSGAVAWFTTRWVPIIALVSLPLGLVLLGLTHATGDTLVVVGGAMLTVAVRAGQVEFLQRGEGAAGARVG